MGLKNLGKTFKTFLVGVFVLAIAALLLAATPSSANAAKDNDPNNFYFESFDAVYELGLDEDSRSTLKTTETLVAVFPEYDQNRGFVRELVLTYDDHPTDLKIVSVTDEKGQERPFSVKNKHDITSVTIAVPKGQFVHGKQTYVLTYTQKDVTKYSEETGVDEFYWNVNGLFWPQEFKKVSATIKFDPGVAKNFTKAGHCYFGYYGDTYRCPIDIGETEVKVQEEDLDPYQNVTFALGFEKDTFAPRPEHFLQKYPFMLYGAVVSGSLALTVPIWSRIAAKKKPRTGKAIIPRYAPPEGVNIAVAGTALKSQKKVMTASLLDLAVRKKIQLLYSEPGNVYGFRIIDTKNLLPIEKHLLSDIVYLDDLSSPELIRPTWLAQQDIALYKAQEKLLREAKKEALLTGVIKKVPKWPGFLTLLLFFLSFALPYFHYRILQDFYETEFYFVVYLALASWVSLIFFAVASAGTKLTRKAAPLYEHLMGLKEYISLAEADRLRLLQGAQTAEVTRDEIVQVYERLLPFATLFGLEESWNLTMEKYYLDSPREWVSDVDGISASGFVAHNFVSSFESSISSVSSGSGGGSGGGSSGGGFSGGGGGGGGGYGV